MISTFIIAATSKDGFIAKDADHNSFKWTSEEDHKRFVELTKRAGVVIVGSKTFKTFKNPLKDRVNIVYSRSQKFNASNVTSTSDNPGVLLNKLDALGFKEAAVIGGAEIYRMFLDKDVVDRIYLTIEPVEFGSGIRFHTGYLDSRFDIVSEKPVNDKGTIFREYVRKTAPALKKS